MAVLETDREKVRILDQLLFRFTKLKMPWVCALFRRRLRRFRSRLKTGP